MELVYAGSFLWIYLNKNTIETVDIITWGGA